MARDARSGVPRVLLVEDEPATAEAVAGYLSRDGLDVVTVSNGLEARCLVEDAADGFDLYLLDLCLPGLSGERLCLFIASRTDAPIIVMSGKARAAEAALELGADDFIAKPFSPREVVARVRAKIRLHDRMSGGGDRLEAGRVRVCVPDRRAFCGDREVGLTEAELRVLATLIQHAGSFLPRESLAREARCAPHSLPTVIRSLRAKLGREEAGLTEVAGRGYRFAPLP